MTPIEHEEDALVIPQRSDALVAEVEGAGFVCADGLGGSKRPRLLG